MAAKQTSLVFTIENSGVTQTLKAFNRLPKAASASLRDRAMELAEVLAGDVRSAARSEGRQAASQAPLVKAKRDRLPVIEAGGSKKVGRHKVPAYATLLGSEFGGNRKTGWYGWGRYSPSGGRQYKPHLGRGSYWFYKTVYDAQAETLRKWLQVADDIERDFLMDPGY